MKNLCCSGQGQNNTRALWCITQVGVLSSVNSHSLPSSHRLHRPCFDRSHRLPDGGVLFDINGSIDRLIPDGRFVRPIYHVDLDFNCSRQRRGAAIHCDGLQFVRLTLNRAKLQGVSTWVNQRRKLAISDANHLSLTLRTSCEVTIQDGCKGRPKWITVIKNGDHTLTF